MSHGTNCHCMMCTVGKKIGMIRREHAQDQNDHDNTCDHCDPVKCDPVKKDKAK